MARPGRETDCTAGLRRPVGLRAGHARYPEWRPAATRPSLPPQCGTDRLHVRAAAGNRVGSAKGRWRVRRLRRGQPLAALRHQGDFAAGQRPAAPAVGGRRLRRNRDAAQRLSDRGGAGRRWRSGTAGQSDGRRVPDIQTAGDAGVRDETLLTFPTDFPIKIMGERRDDFAQTMVELVRRHAPDFRAETVEMRVSRNGNYLSVTCVVRATSRAQLDALYREITAHPWVKMAL